MSYEEYFEEVCSFLPNNGEGMSETESGIIEAHYVDGDLPEETADYIKYSIGGYSLDEYIADIEELCDFCINAINPDIDEL